MIRQRDDGVDGDGSLQPVGGSEQQELGLAASLDHAKEVLDAPSLEGPGRTERPQAFFSTDPDMDPARIIAIFMQHWQIEVTFQEVPAQLGVETLRQWSEAESNEPARCSSGSTAWSASRPGTSSPRPPEILRSRLVPEVQLHLLRRLRRRTGPTLDG